MRDDVDIETNSKPGEDEPDTKDSETGEDESDTEDWEAAEQTKEAEALASALNRSAVRVQTLWFSFLIFMVYLATATWTTTHRMLFLEEQLTLPVLNLKLPLLGFYILTPFIFVVFHFYMLLSLVLLARTAKSFEDALVPAFPEDGEGRENFRMRIENTLFVQLLVGAKREREGTNAWFLSAMAFITLALAPVALLLMFEIKFLPYHSEPISWWQRFLLFADLALVWALWPSYRSCWGNRLWPPWSWRLAPAGVMSLVALAYAVLVVTFPDEWIYRKTTWVHGKSHRDFEGELRWDSRPGWYAWIEPIVPVNALVLHGQGLIDGDKLKNINEKNKDESGEIRWEPVLVLTDRDLIEADLRDTDIRQIDFSGTKPVFDRANLDRVWAKQAHFSKASFSGAHLAKAQLQGAWLLGAQLQGASLEDAQLQGALLVWAQLQGASSLDGVQLQGASLLGAQLQGASLEDAQLQGALLDGAQLQGASLDSAPLQGASLQGAQLQGASLEDAQLQGAWLNWAQLQGASLSRANLRGALLRGAQLQGALLERAQLQGAILNGACVWRADARKAIWADTPVRNPNTNAKASPDIDDECDWTIAEFDNLKKLIAEQVPEGEVKREAMKRIEKALDPNKTFEEEAEIARDWARHESQSPSGDAYANALSKVGCAAEGAPYVVRALLNWFDSLIHSPFAKDIADIAKVIDMPKTAAAFLKPDCVGARGLTEAEIANLKEIAAKAPPSAPKQ